MNTIRDGTVSASQHERVVNSIGSLSDMEIYVDDTALQSVMAMRGKALRLKRERGLDFIVIDYMQLFEGSSKSGGYSGNRVQEVSEISRHIKGMARDLNIPVMALSQLSRSIERRDPPYPILADLRESGSIEQDADVVMFIHREDRFTNEEKWNQKHPDIPYPRGKSKLIVAKQRHGPTGEVELAVRDDIGRFFRPAFTPSRQPNPNEPAGR